MRATSRRSMLKGMAAALLGVVAAAGGLLGSRSGLPRRSGEPRTSEAEARAQRRPSRAVAPAPRSVKRRG